MYGLVCAAGMAQHSRGMGAVPWAGKALVAGAATEANAL